MVLTTTCGEDHCRSKVPAIGSLPNTWHNKVSNPAIVSLQEDGADDEMDDDLGDQQGARPKPSRTLAKLETNHRVVGQERAARNRELKAIQDSELKRVLSPDFVKRYVLYVRRYRYKVSHGRWGQALYAVLVTLAALQQKGQLQSLGHAFSIS